MSTTASSSAAAASNQKVIDLLGEDTKLWSPSTQQEASPAELLSNKVVLFYFSASWCAPCRRFTPMLIELYNKLKSSNNNDKQIVKVEDFELVFCSMDRTEDDYKAYCRKMPWWCLPYQSAVMGKVANLYGARGIPHLVVLEKDGNVMQSDGVGSVSIDPDGTDFPWRPKPIVDLLPAYYLSSRDKTMLVPMSDLDDKYLMLYFSATSSIPCKRFTPKLSKAYQALKKQQQQHKDDFELLFVSSDHNQHAFDEYFAEMTFGALPYNERKAKADLSSRLDVRGIPTLVMLGPKPANGEGDRPIINANVRPIIESGDYLSEFPYEPKPYGSLDKTTDDINNYKCLIVFHEGGDDDEQDDIRDVLQTVANKNTGNNDQNMRFYWAFSPDNLSKTVRDALGLGSPSEEPLMVLLNIPDGGSYYVSRNKDITVESVEAFLASPGKKRSLSRKK